MPHKNSLILDIDIDFWVDHIPTDSELIAIKKLYSAASLCTIALSPYFIPIEKSIEITKKIISYIRSS
jgi:hypothetical protein